MDISFPTHTFVKKVSFEFATPESIRRLSVKQVTTAQMFDSLSNPVPKGLYDPAMGPIDKNARCPTCSQTAFQCPGHFGHIELAVPVYAPMNFGSMYQLLRQVCLYCHRLRSTRVRVALTTAKLRLLQSGQLMEAVGLDVWLDHQVESNEADLEAVEESGTSQDHVVRLDESVIIDRLNRHVKQLIQKKKSESGIIERKSAAVQAQRQAVINEFLKKISRQQPVSSLQVPGARSSSPRQHQGLPFALQEATTLFIARRGPDGREPNEVFDPNSHLRTLEEDLGE